MTKEAAMSIFDDWIESIKEEVEVNDVVKLDDFLEFTKKSVKRYSYTSRPVDEKGERERVLRYYSALRVKPVGAMRDLIKEIDEEQYRRNNSSKK